MIVLESGGRTEKPESMAVISHLCLLDQFFGFAASASSSQVT